MIFGLGWVPLSLMAIIVFGIVVPLLTSAWLEHRKDKKADNE